MVKVVRYVEDPTGNVKSFDRIDDATCVRLAGCVRQGLLTTAKP